MKITFKIYQIIFWSAVVLTVLTLMILTSDAIGETDNWQWFNIDYSKKSEIVSAYGALLGGVLAFLAILFVIYGLMQQSERALQEKLDKVKEYNDNLLYRLKLLSIYLKTLITDIESHGKRMKSFYESEKTHPSTMNTIYFNPNKNFDRILDSDDTTTYKSIQHYFKNEESEKLFINLYNSIDFYNETLKDQKEKYAGRINDKVTDQKRISSELRQLSSLCGELIDNYLKEFGQPNYLSYDWSKLINNFLSNYNLYLKECDDEKKVTDLRKVSDDFLFPLLKSGMELRSTIGYDELGSKQIMKLASNIRKNIYEMESFSLQYANDFEKNYKHYFSGDSDYFNTIKQIKKQIDSKIKELGGW